MSFVWVRLIQAFEERKILTRVNGKQQIHRRATLEHCVNRGWRDFSIDLVPERPGLILKYYAPFPDGSILGLSGKDLHFLQGQRLARFQESHVLEPQSL